MRGKKFLASILLVSVLSIYPLIGANAKPVERGNILAEEVIAISAPLERSSYLSFSGTVKEIELRQPAEGLEELRYLFVENEDGQVAYFVITKDTYLLNEEQLEVGARVTGFYDATRPMIMIYPPHYPVEVVAVNPTDNLKVDVFDQDLVSADGKLKLNITDQTEIITQDGAAYQGKLGNQKLLVLFESSTKSIPAQTNPIKVIVLQSEDEIKKEPADKILNGQAKQLKLLIDGQKISVPSAYVNKKDVLMVPLRAVAERLNLKLTWHKTLAQVVIADKITLTIGQDKYLKHGSQAVSLGISPELKNGRTFVPLSFFEKVLGKAVVSLEQ